MVLPKKVVKEDGNTIQCVATVDGSDANNPPTDKKSDNIYINLRFKPTSNTIPKKYDGNFYHFAISGAEFGQMNETTVENYKVWDIQY